MTVAELIAKLSEVNDKAMEVYLLDSKRVKPIPEVKISKSHFIPQNGDEPEESKFVMIS